MDFLAHFFFGESSFVQAGSRRSWQVFGDYGEAAPKTVALERADNLDTRSFLDVVEDLHVAAQAFFVEHIAR